jgi:hypothetical protein
MIPMRFLVLSVVILAATAGGSMPEPELEYTYEVDSFSVDNHLAESQVTLLNLYSDHSSEWLLNNAPAARGTWSEDYEYVRSERFLILNDFEDGICNGGDGSECRGSWSGDSSAGSVVFSWGPPEHRSVLTLCVLQGTWPNQHEAC